MANRANSIKQGGSSHRGKVLIAIWILTITVLVGFIITGYLQNELIGYILLSFLPAAVLVNISIVISYSTASTARDGFKFAKIVWSFLCMLVIIFTLKVPIMDSQESDSYFAAGAFIIYPMMVFSFPSGYLWVSLYGGIIYTLDYFGLSVPFSFGRLDFYITNFVLWLGFFIVGYLQWFKLIPFIIEKWQNKKS
ncbi:MAG: hypothetical protein RBT37_09845 [Dissulfurispiraceae bacterium]|nr:hypothetical protein [Dissulfurispiraceae bacterium]